MARLFSFRPGITFRGRAFHGIRGWAGKPTHPPLTDFPIVSYVLAAIFDLISFLGHGSSADPRPFARDLYVAGTYVIIAGAIVSLAAATTGFWDWWRGVEREPTGLLGRARHTQVWRTINAHATIMLSVTAIAVADIVARLAQSDDPYSPGVVVVLSVAAAALVSIGATYGGSLVYDHQVNVESLKASTAWDETEVDQLPGGKVAPQTTTE